MKPVKREEPREEKHDKSTGDDPAVGHGVTDVETPGFEEMAAPLHAQP